jgi:hypothetical protein
MKNFSLFLSEVVEAEKQMVKYIPPTHTAKKISNIRFPHPASEVTHGVYEEIHDMLQRDNTGREQQQVHEFLGSHEDAHGLISNIMTKMGSSDQELIQKHDLHNRVGDMIEILSDPHYMKSFSMSI